MSEPDLLPAIAGRFPRRQRIQNVFDNPAFWRTAAVIPPQDQSAGGATRMFPEWVALAWDTLIHDFHSSVEVGRELNDPDIWGLFVAAGRRQFPNDESQWVKPERPMRRFHYNYAKSVYLKPLRFQLGDAHRRCAAEQAVVIGCCVPEPGASWTHPSTENCISADGKAITGRSKQPRLDRNTGELRPRCEPDLETYVTGGGELVTGVGFVFLNTRMPAVNERIILDVIDAPAKGGEVAHAMKSFRRTLPLLPGGQVVLYDGALRGSHRHDVFAMGMIPVSPIRNKDNQVPRERPYDFVEVRWDDGTTTREPAHLIDGALQLKNIADDGTPLYTPCKRIKTTRPRQPTGATYNEYEIVRPDGGRGTTRVRVTSDARDRKRGFNREEWLHAIATGDPDYYRLLGQRNDAESGNSSLDYWMPHQKAHSFGRPGILVNLITWAIYRNSQALALNRMRAGPHVELAA